MSETPTPQPSQTEMITHVPTAEELQATGMDPRLEHTLTRGALSAITNGETGSAQELNAKYPSPTPEATPQAASEAPVAPSVDLPAPYEVPEHERTQTAEQMAQLREQLRQSGDIK